MSALARYYHSRGATVYGYDRTPSALTQQMENEGMAIHYEDKPNNLPALIDTVIYTPAVPKDLKEFKALQERGIPMLKRAEALGEISKDMFTIAVAGTHGKTTTTAMVAHILCENGIDMTAFIGGIAKNFNSNIHIGSDKGILVAEADEFDRSFLKLHPDISIINAIDADHLDIYGDEQHLIAGFEDFARLTEKKVIFREGLPLHKDARSIVFGTSDGCAFRATDIVSSNGTTTFDIVAAGNSTHITLPMAGIHNVMNATAAFAATLELGLEPSDIAKAISTFSGVSRRFDIRVNNKRYCYIDDYAHHPEEIKSCLSAIRESFPTKEITLVFQPHLFTRTRDLMEEFATSLAMADRLILLDIYPAREKPIEGITSNALLQKVALQNKQVCSKDNLMNLIGALKPEMLVTMGAGDIDRFVEPIEKMITAW